MRKCADMKYHFAAKLRIYPSSEQKHMIAVNDGVSRYVYNRMTANDRDLHAMKKAADMCPAYRERVAYLEQVRSSKKELVNTIPFLNEKNVDSLAVDNAIKNHNLAWNLLGGRERALCEEECRRTGAASHHAPYAGGDPFPLLGEGIVHAYLA